MNTSTKIRAAIVLKETTQTKIGNEIGVSKQAINDVIHGAPSARIRKAISRTLNIPMSIWDELDRELASKEKNP